MHVILKRSRSSEYRYVIKVLPKYIEPNLSGKELSKGYAMFPNAENVQSSPLSS
jgi:hypothetical protein